MSVLAIISARGGYKGIPRKNIKALAGRPLIEWTIDAAKRAFCVNRIIVSTEDENIASVARELGADVPFFCVLPIWQRVKRQGSLQCCTRFRSYPIMTGFYYCSRPHPCALRKISMGSGSSAKSKAHHRQFLFAKWGNIHP